MSLNVGSTLLIIIIIIIFINNQLDYLKLHIETVQPARILQEKDAIRTLRVNSSILNIWRCFFSYHAIIWLAFVHAQFLLLVAHSQLSIHIDDSKRKRYPYRPHELVNLINNSSWTFSELDNCVTCNIKRWNIGLALLLRQCERPNSLILFATRCKIAWANDNHPSNMKSTIVNQLKQFIDSPLY